MAKRKLLAVDFDGTIAHHGWPDIGEPIDHAFEVMKELQAAGYDLILVTCREDEPYRKYLTEAVNYCRERGVEFRSVNCNLAEDDFREFGGRKVYAQYYIDDRNIGGFLGWLKVRQILLHQPVDPVIAQLEAIGKEIQNGRNKDNKTSSDSAVEQGTNQVPTQEAQQEAFQESQRSYRQYYRANS